MLRFSLVLHLALASFSFKNVYAETSAERRLDIEDALRNSMCAKTEREAAVKPLRLWQAGIYDAQMEASWIEAEEAIDPAELEQAAQEQAATLNHGGYAYGFCGKQHAWILSSPASGPVLEKKAGNILILNSSRLAQACQRLDVDAAGAQSGQSRVILAGKKPQEEAMQINAGLLNAGTLSVTCHPPEPQKRGPELWALMPVGEWEHVELPHVDLLEAENFKSLRAWLQTLRKDLNLRPLQQDHALLARFAKDLLSHSSIRHPRPLIKKQAEELKKSRGHWLGENRVKGSRISEMAWLLWHSPQHRRLLLNPKANAIGLNISQKTPEKLLVMVIARI